MPKTILPNLHQYGYQATSHLFTNFAGGRSSYKAINLKTKQPVFIKQFRFATGESWSSFKLLQREIETLEKLDHPHIPKFIESRETDEGLILVTEFIEGSHPSSLSLDNDKILNIGEQLLEILVYLQSFGSPISHRDIKPENILIDAEGNAHLVDFGIASANLSDSGASTVLSGTKGLIPPESLFSNITTSSDLYSLAGTLVLLFARKPTSWLSSIVDSTGIIRPKEHLLPHNVSPTVIRWIEKNLSRQPEKRHASAESALRSLRIARTQKSALLPNIKTAQRSVPLLGQKATQLITKHRNLLQKTAIVTLTTGTVIAIGSAIDFSEIETVITSFLSSESTLPDTLTEIESIPLQFIQAFLTLIKFLCIFLTLSITARGYISARSNGEYGIFPILKAPTALFFTWFVFKFTLQSMTETNSLEQALFILLN